MKKFLDKSLRFASIVLIAVMMAIGFYSYYLEGVFLQDRPIVAIPDAGQIYPANIRGKIVYLDRREYMLDQWLFKVGLLIGFAGGVLWVTADRKRARADEKGGRN